MLLVDDLAAGGTKNLRHTPRGLVTLDMRIYFFYHKHSYAAVSKGKMESSHVTCTYIIIMYMYITNIYDPGCTRVD